MTPSPQDKPKILLVDDQPANLLALRRLLARSGADLIEAHDGSEALMACLEHEFALILLDVHMPGIDGYEVATSIIEGDEQQNTPIIFLTAAYDNELHRLRGYQAGAVDYIAKPIDDYILTAKVRIFLDLWIARRREQELAAQLAERNVQLHREIAERQKAEAAARHQAVHDPLTGLPNRLFFVDQCEKALERGGSQDVLIAIFYIDIDGFKPVNDTHGHGAGDELLRQIADRLRTNVRRADSVARLGGDEFAMIIEGLTDVEPIARIGHAVCESLREPFELQSANATVQIGASVGVAIYPTHGDTRDLLLRAADDAMYRAKRGGRNRVEFAQMPMPPAPPQLPDLHA